MKIEQASDSELLKKWAGQQCEVSFREIVRRHAPLVHGASHRVSGDPHIAAEAAQLTFIAMANKAAQLASHPELMGWLHLTAVRHTRNLTRKSSREKLKIDTLEAQVSTTPNEPCREWEEVRPLLDDALSRMRRKEREIILLRYIGGLSVRDIGNRLEISVDAAQKRLNRAILQLRTLLAKRGYQSQASLGTVLAFGIGSEAILSTARAAELGTQVLAVAKATAAAAPFTTKLLNYIIMKKSTIVVVAILVAAGLGTVTLVRNRQTAATRVVNIQSRPAGERSPSGNSTGKPFPANPRQGKANRVKSYELKIVSMKQEYGEARANLSQQVGEQILKIFDYITEVEEILLNGDPPLYQRYSENLFRDPRMESLGLDASQKQRILQEFLKFRRKKAEEHRNFKAAMMADPTTVMEQLLIEDSIAKKDITPQEAKERQTLEGAAARDMIGRLPGESGLDMDNPLFGPDFREKLSGILTGPQFEQLVKADESAESRDSAEPKDGTPTEAVPPTSGGVLTSDFPTDPNSAATLESLYKEYTSMKLLMGGMKGLLQSEVLSSGSK